MSPPTPQLNAKRYWGEEKNIDSIYSIYLKKICYTYNNDISLSASNNNDSCRRNSQDDARSLNSTASSIDLAKFAIQSSRSCSSNSSSKRTINSNKLDSNCQKQEESPRGRRNFFQKYRRRSCSMDKYSFDKHHKGDSSSISTNSNSTKSCSKTMKYPVSHKTKDTSQLSDELSVSHDDLDGLTPTGKNNSNGFATADKQNHTKQQDINLSLQKSMNDLSIQTPSQSLQWETRQIKILQAATLDHVLKFILLINSPKDLNNLNSDSDSSIGDSTLEEERNNVAHIIHVLFCTYRIYTNPYELMLKLMDYSDICRIEQYRFVMHYWMDNYPEDFDYIEEKIGVSLVNELLRLCRDEYIRKKAMKLSEMRTGGGSDGSAYDSEGSRRGRHHSHHQSGSKNSAILDFDSRYVAQQLTAIDLENFLSLRPYSLLEGTKSDKRIQSMIKNFNLLSRHVVVTILKSHNPHTVASHWIAIAMNLRKIKNFNSLKAIIAGLTNESIHRLKQLIWNKLDRNSLANFKLIASIVDDVNNQIVLRQTQLIVEGTAKMSIEDDSFGTIPYLGTFLTDLNMIDARYQSYVPSPKDETSKLKLINFEKCAKQFEILTQVQLLQKNVLASLHAIQRRNHFDEQTTLNRLKLEFNQNHQILLAKPAIPQVSRLFENWFHDNSVASMTDKQW